MRHLGSSATGALLLACTTSYVMADVGVLDKYECHKSQQTKEYHCHGPDHLAKLGGFIVGADTRFQGWSGDSNDLFVFAGAAANVEYNYKWFAATGSYFMMPLITNADPNNFNFDSSVYLKGWEIGTKFGPGVGRFGTKTYFTAGWSSPEIIDTGNSDNNEDLSGYYVGAGFGLNTQTFVIDFIATYRDSSAVSDYLASKGKSPNVMSFDTRVGIGWRF